MTQRIDVADLREGMYVSSLDRPWTTTSFLFQGFEITDQRQIAQLRQLCRHVFIDPERGRGPLRAKTPRSVPSPAGVPAAWPPSTRAGRPGLVVYGPATAAVEQEIGSARALEMRGRNLVQTIMDDVRLGRSLDVAEAQVVVSGMVESIIRNPDALVWFTHLRKVDEYTAIHSLRVCILALTFGRHLGFEAEELKMLGIGALLHDIGKLRVSAEILNKPAGLTQTEYEHIKRHVPEGVKLLEATKGIPPAAIDVARNHHEHYSGAGYVNGLSGDRIGQFGLIGAIVDAYDAITSDRSYKKALSPQEALGKLYQGRGRQFHGELVEQFIQCMGVYPIGSIVEMESGAVGVVVTVNRTRRLRPRIALVLDAEKRACPPGQIVELADGAQDTDPCRRIRRVLPAGAYGVDPAACLPRAM
ncbi:MAG: HD-GYP domain-containing protein [Acidiferrobacteraceae bacterium]